MDGQFVASVGEDRSICIHLINSQRIADFTDNDETLSQRTMVSVLWFNEQYAQSYSN